MTCLCREGPSRPTVWDHAEHHVDPTGPRSQGFILVECAELGIQQAPTRGGRSRGRGLLDSPSRHWPTLRTTRSPGGKSSTPGARAARAAALSLPLVCERLSDQLPHEAGSPPGTGPSDGYDCARGEEDGAAGAAVTLLTGQKGGFTLPVPGFQIHFPLLPVRTRLPQHRSAAQAARGCSARPSSRQWDISRVCMGWRDIHKEALDGKHTSPPPLPLPTGSGVDVRAGTQAAMLEHEAKGGRARQASPGL